MLYTNHYTLNTKYFLCYILYATLHARLGPRDPLRGSPRPEHPRPGGGPKYVVHTMQYTESGIWYMVYGMWGRVRGVWHMVYGAQYIEKREESVEKGEKREETREKIIEITV